MVIILMGVVGSGKTTVGTLLAQKLGWSFADADDFHSAQNIAKIRQGIALDDADRAPWLAALHDAIAGWNADGINAVLACSALKHSYRQELSVGQVTFVYLRGRRDLILERLRSRHGHFATEAILNTQFADLEEPERAITVSIEDTPEKIADTIISRLSARNPANRGRSLGN